MFDISKRVEAKELKGKQLKEIVAGIPDDCLICFNGDTYGFVHFEEDMSVVSFDDASLDEEYSKN